MGAAKLSERLLASFDLTFCCIVLMADLTLHKWTLVLADVVFIPVHLMNHFYMED